MRTTTQIGMEEPQGTKVSIGEVYRNGVNIRRKNKTQEIIEEQTEIIDHLVAINSDLNWYLDQYILGFWGRRLQGGQKHSARLMAATTLCRAFSYIYKLARLLFWSLTFILCQLKCVNIILTFW